MFALYTLQTFLANFVTCFETVYSVRSICVETKPEVETKTAINLNIYVCLGHVEKKSKHQLRLKVFQYFTFMFHWPLQNYFVLEQYLTKQS